MLHFAAERGMSLRRAAYLRVWRHSRPPRWVRELQVDCRQPPSWSGRWSWPANDCRELVARARALLRGEVADPCRGQATGWRAHGRALRRALQFGYVTVECGATLHAFVREGERC